MSGELSRSPDKEECSLDSGEKIIQKTASDFLSDFESQIDKFDGKEKERVQEEYNELQEKFKKDKEKLHAQFEGLKRNNTDQTCSSLMQLMGQLQPVKEFKNDVKGIKNLSRLRGLGANFGVFQGLLLQGDHFGKVGGLDQQEKLYDMLRDPKKIERIFEEYEKDSEGEKYAFPVDTDTFEDFRKRFYGEPVEKPKKKKAEPEQSVESENSEKEDMTKQFSELEKELLQGFDGRSSKENEEMLTQLFQLGKALYLTQESGVIGGEKCVFTRYKKLEGEYKKFDIALSFKSHSRTLEVLLDQGKISSTQKKDYIFQMEQGNFANVEDFIESHAKDLNDGKSLEKVDIQQEFKQSLDDAVKLHNSKRLLSQYVDFPEGLKQALASVEKYRNINPTNPEEATLSVFKELQASIATVNDFYTQNAGSNIVKALEKAKEKDKKKALKSVPAVEVVKSGEVQAQVEGVSAIVNTIVGEPATVDRPVVVGRGEAASTFDYSSGEYAALFKVFESQMTDEISSTFKTLNVERPENLGRPIQVGPQKASDVAAMQFFGSTQGAERSVSGDIVSKDGTKVLKKKGDTFIPYIQDKESGIQLKATHVNIPRTREFDQKRVEHQKEVSALDETISRSESRLQEVDHLLQKDDTQLGKLGLNRGDLETKKARIAQERDEAIDYKEELEKKFADELYQEEIKFNEKIERRNHRTLLFLKSISYNLIPESIMTDLKLGKLLPELGGMDFNAMNFKPEDGRFGEGIFENGNKGEVLLIRLINKMVTGNIEGKVPPYDGLLIDESLYASFTVDGDYPVPERGFGFNSMLVSSGFQSGTGVDVSLARRNLEKKFL